MSVTPCSDTTQQVFIVGIDPNGFMGNRTYTADVDLETATTDNLWQVIANRTRIPMNMLQRQFRITRRSALVQSGTPLASQGISKEATLHLEWLAGIIDNNECTICAEAFSSETRRMVFCRQTLDNGTVQMRTHRSAFHVTCLEKLRQNGAITCPLCRGEVNNASLILP